MVIRFRPGKLGAKPDSITRRWDVYPKEGDIGYAQVNPQNFRPIFTNEQFTTSLRATFLEGPILPASVILDFDTLHSNIRNALPLNADSTLGLEFAKDDMKPHWTLAPKG